MRFIKIYSQTGSVKFVWCCLFKGLRLAIESNALASIR